MKTLEIAPLDVRLISELQRKKMEIARRNGTFDAEKHLRESPIGRAVANGFPLVRR